MSGKFTKEALGKPFAKGSFTQAYNHPTDFSKVVLISCDPIKDVMSNGWFPDAEDWGWDSPLYPTLTKIDYCEWIRQSGNWYIYETDRLEKPRSLKQAMPEKDYRLFKSLFDFMNNDVYGISKTRYDTISYLHKKIAESKCIEDWTKDFLMASVSSTANGGNDPTFEISQRNVGVLNGRLVLMDTWFYISELTKSNLRRGV